MVFTTNNSKKKFVIVFLFFLLSFLKKWTKKFHFFLFTINLFMWDVHNYFQVEKIFKFKKKIYFKHFYWKIQMHIGKEIVCFFKFTKKIMDLWLFGNYIFKATTKIQIFSSPFSHTLPPTHTTLIYILYIHFFANY